MKRLLCLIFILFMLSGSAFGRDNPFVPALKQDQMPVTSSDPQVKQTLRTQEIKLPQGAKLLHAVTVHYQDSSGEVKSKEYAVDKKVDWHYPLKLTQSTESAPKKHYTLTDFVSITQKDYTATVHSSDMVIRDFHLTDPFKIVLDFRSDKSFATQTVQMEKPFEKAVVGEHRGYYRIVLQMDAVYEYALTTIDKGVKLELK